MFGLLDTGAPSSSLTASTAADLMNLGVPAGSSRVPAGTKLLFTINQKTSFPFTAGTPTISLGRTSTYSNLGQLPYRSLDVLYDHMRDEPLSEAERKQVEALMGDS